MKVTIIDYGAGNIQSLKFAFKRLGIESTVSSSIDEISSADKVIFPGVGEASNAMAKLRATGIDSLLPKLNQPVLGICLGMQLMCKWCEEGDTKGLGIFDVDIIRFPDNVKVPQIGWNQIENLRTKLFDQILEKEYMYHVHSYYAPLTEASIAVSHYGVKFSAAMNTENFFGVQFHPEKSSKAGSRILENFLTI